MRFRFLRQRSVFLIGFGIGFISTLLLFLLRNIFVANLLYDQESWQALYGLHEKPYHKEIILRHWRKEKKATDSLNSITYNAWLATQNLKLHKIDLDKYVYGPKRDENKEYEKIEQHWLKEQVSITCVVFVEKLKLGKSIQNTWGKRCNNIYFFSHHLKDKELPIVNAGTKIVSSWQLLCEAMNYIWNDKKANNLKWILFVKDDTMVIPENLRYIVAPLNYYDDHYLGHPVIMWGRSYNVAQSGYVLSKGALAKIIQMFNNSEKCIAGGKYWKKEDYYLGK